MSDIETTIRTTNAVHEIITNDPMVMHNLYKAMAGVPHAVRQLTVRDCVMHAVLERELIDITVEPPEEDEE